jgi:hypothetical protein
MSLDFIALPYGCHDVRLYPLTGETPGTGVDLPNSQTFSFDEAEAFDELKGDDNLVAIHGKGPAVDWALDNGGISFEAVQTIYGGTITVTGTTPNQVKKFSKKATDVRPYFKVEGQAVSDSGGDFHVIIYRCKATGNLKGVAKEGTFWITGAQGKALGRASDQLLYDMVQNETQVNIP